MSRVRWRWAVAFVPSLVIASCSSEGSDAPRSKGEGERATIQLALGGGDASPTFASVRICGARNVPADGKYLCNSSLPASPCPCFNVDPDGIVTIEDLCASADVPTSGWSFDYAIYEGTDCTGTQLNDGLHGVTCYDSQDLRTHAQPNASIETLPSGTLVNHVLCERGTTPDLRTAASFAVLGGTTVTNTGATTTIVGDLGVSPGTSITGIPAGQPTGMTYTGGDAVVVQAQADLSTLYDDLAGRTCPVANDLTGQDLAGLTLDPGIYCFDSSAALSAGALVLDAKNAADAYWVFQIGSTLTVASFSSVTVIHGGTACNVFWQVGSSATVSANAVFAGNLVAFTSITLDTQTSVSPGRVLARGGAVTMDSNQVSIAGCAQ